MVAEELFATKRDQSPGPANDRMRISRAELQERTISALEHLAGHGNVNILASVWSHARTLSPELAKRWRAYVVAYSFLEYNPGNLKGRALSSAPITDIWVKNKEKKMSLEAAQLINWFEYKPIDYTYIDLHNVEDYAQIVTARLQKLLDTGRLLRAGNLADVAGIRLTFSEYFDRLIDPERSRMLADAQIRHKPTKIASAPGMHRRGSPTVSGGLPSLGKKR